MITFSAQVSCLRSRDLFERFFLLNLCGLDNVNEFFV